MAGNREFVVSFDWSLIELDWRPFLEIAILSFAIYWILMFVQRTRAWHVVSGFAAFLALLVFTMILDLDVLNMILRYFFSFSALAILILFHQEIRRMLATIGSFFHFYSVRQRRENLETIVQTADRLADANIGALIAIEQSVDLDPIVESGLPIHCEASAEMFETIFFPNNAIHDGGVIVRGDQIEKAACIFPLTQRKDLNNSLGTRHRAAMGLSEESDAVIVAISEETKMISYAYQGQLVRGISPDELRSFLASLLVSETKPRPSRARIDSKKPSSSPSSTTRGFFKLYPWIRRRLIWKAASIFIATFLWIALHWDLVKQNQNESNEHSLLTTLVYEDVPIHLLKKPAQTSSIILNPTSVRVKLKGKSSILENVNASDIRVYADLIQSIEMPLGNAFYIPLKWAHADEWEVEFIEPHEVAVKILD